jgi:hypothetical protein
MRTRPISVVALAVSLVLGSFATSASAAGVTTSITAPTTLTGSATFSFSGAVKNVTSSNVVLRLRGTTTDVASSLSCKTSTGATTSCAIGAVRTVVLQPSRHLTPGEQYVLAVNPSGTLAPVVDSFGNSVPSALRTFIGSLYEEEKSAAASYQWRPVSASPAYGGSYQSDYYSGASFIFRFKGTSATWYTVTGPNQGRASVYLDGRFLWTVNNYASSLHYRVARPYRGLRSIEHVLRIVVLGQRGSSAGTGTWISADAFAISGALVSSPRLSFGWQAVSNTAASGDRYVRVGTPGATVSFVFRGRSIDWVTITGPTQGTASMYVDGVKKLDVNNTSSTVHYGVIRRVSNLPDAVHTLTVRSGRSITSIDRFIVRLPEVTIFRKLGAWVDLFDYGTSSGLDPASAIAAMHSHGVRTLYVETARYNSSSSFDFPTYVGQWIEAAHASGMKIVGWYFPTYGTYLSTDVSRTIAIANYRSPAGQGFDGLAIDIEHKTSAQSRTAWFSDIATHLSRVRTGVTAAFAVGAIIPAPLAMDIYPSSWSGFPWSAIGRYSDAVLPMAYWSYRTDCSTNPSHCPYGYAVGNTNEARQKTGLPVHLIGGIADQVTSTEVADFIRGARDAKAYGASLYDYRTTSSALWSPLAGANAL